VKSRELRYRFAMPQSVTLDLPVPPPRMNGGRSHAMSRQIWKNECDMAALAQLAGAPRVDGPYALEIIMRQTNNGGVLTTYVNDLIAYLRERELVHSGGPAHLKRLVLAWGDADDAPEGVRLQLSELPAAA
jgi:hypothetical protein